MTSGVSANIRTKPTPLPLGPSVGTGTPSISYTDTGIQMQISCRGRMKLSVCTNIEFVTVVAYSYTQQLTTKQDNAMTYLFHDKLSGYSAELLTPLTFSKSISTIQD